MSGSTNADAKPDSRWWLPIAALLGVVLLQGLVGYVLPPDPASLLPVMVPLLLLGFGLQLASPVCVYYDRRYLAAVSDWEPSKWYYAMVLPPLSVFLPPLYLYQRHKYVGVP